MTNYEERKAIREYRQQRVRVYRVASFATICLASIGLVGLAGITLFLGLAKYWEVAQQLFK